MAGPKKAGGRSRRVETVRQTILESVEAPHLTDVTTGDFVRFKERSSVYERQVVEKDSETGIQVPLTSYRNSIELSILELFVMVNWVPVDKVESITEAHIHECVEKRSHFDPTDYDLARIEREIQYVTPEKADMSSNLQRQFWRLYLQYTEKLRQCRYDGFVKKQPKLAIRYFLRRVTHSGLRTRMELTLQLCKEELEKDFSQFIRLLAAEAQTIDLQDSARDYREGLFSSEDDLRKRTGTRSHRRNHLKSSRSVLTPTATNRNVPNKSSNPVGKAESRKRNLELPHCQLRCCKKIISPKTVTRPRRRKRRGNHRSIVISGEELEVLCQVSAAYMLTTRQQSHHCLQLASFVALIPRF